jgi:hypothetical protein
LNPLLFAGTLAIALTSTLLIVSAQTMKAALSDPVKSLRYE